ncbi:RNA polymerase sigma factor [Thalassotalea sp. Y01]|uniref:RNA polymerase sigma factor n=1 Tax=Thalassotalea sp. Y01 TaxID=2729613 RepID=UPI00145EDF22|nr:RNA polymerase sigma factor [Thalassotalea sp. Y01]NMP16571.1 RNA polymerase sigma factor [Thalassotalea sp. Y01]
MIKISSLRWSRRDAGRDMDNASANTRTSFWQGLRQALHGLSSASNEQLIRAFAKRQDETALHLLVDRLHQDVFHYVLSQSDKTLAQDITQITWLKVLDKATLFVDKGGNSGKAWVYRIARNALIDELRSQQRWQFETLDEVHVANQESLQTLEQDADLQQAFNNVLANLPFAQREAFVLQQEGFSIIEISEICQEKSETIKSRLRYARNTFKQLLGGYHE